MYLGVYKRQCDEIESTVTYESLGFHFQKQIAQFAIKHRWYDKDNLIEKYQDRAREYEGDEDWAQMNEADRKLASVKQVMLHHDGGFSMQTVPVEFVRFDQAQEL